MGDVADNIVIWTLCQRQEKHETVEDKFERQFIKGHNKIYK